MKKLLSLLAICAVSLSAFAETPPSDASIDKLLAVTDSQKLINGTWPQVEANFKNAFIESIGSTSLNNEQQKIADTMSKQLAAVYKEEFSWDKMKPVFVEAYKDTFTQEEVDGMLEFYNSKVGKAVTQKMPVVMQATMSSVQQQMTRLMPKLQKIQQDAIDSIEAKADSSGH